MPGGAQRSGPISVPRCDGADLDGNAEQGDAARGSGGSALAATCVAPFGQGVGRAITP